MNHRVLILEDDDLLSSLLAIALDRAGYESVTTSDLESANALLDSGGFDLVVSDHVLGGEHLGDAFTAKCVTEGRVAAAILISGLADIRQPENRQCSTFLQKPFTMAAFLEAVASALGRAQSELG